MSRKKADWEKWHEERERFARRETEGFEGDIKALEAHIKNLREVSPKDSAGYPVGDALSYIADLERKLSSIKSYVGRATN